MTFGCCFLNEQNVKDNASAMRNCPSSSNLIIYTAYPSELRESWSQSYLTLGEKWGTHPGQIANLLQANTKRHKAVHAHIHTYWQFRVAS